MISIHQARQFYPDDDPIHGFDHVLRVLALAERIALAEGADLPIVRAAALLHDIGRESAQATGQDHAQIAAEQAQTILAHAPPDQVQAVVQAIRAHRFRAGPPPASLEGRVLFDADKLDAIGAIGIARVFAYSGREGRRLWAPVADDYLTRWQKGQIAPGEHTAVHEFVVKLARLQDRLYTPTGRRIAAERHTFMTQFFQRLADEVAGRC